jgi:polyphenol oxidase
MNPPYLISTLLQKNLRVSHGFFTRLGGVSDGLFNSLNTGRFKGDSDDNVFENRHRIANVFGKTLDDLIIVTQRHTNIVHLVDSPWQDTPPEGDALITTNPNLILSIQTADCVPILLADSEKPLVAAIHAGWKGALSGVVVNTVQKMLSMGASPETLTAAIGPCIWQDSYEVDDAYKSQFEGFDQLFKQNRPGHFLFNLPGYVEAQLKKLGIQNISPSLADTCTQQHLFFSNRRAFLNQESTFGVQLSVIKIEQKN